VSPTYFDSSALVKLILDEDGSEEARALWDGASVRVASRIAHPEVRAALAATHRNHDLSDDDLATVETTWSRFWVALRAVELTDIVESQAGDLAGAHALSGADAVHLASALTVDDPDLVVAVWDRRLHRACRVAGLAVAPAEV
jgi:predicted nucleic acid-binding protein